MAVSVVQGADNYEPSHADVFSEDCMAAHCSQLPGNRIETTSNRIVNEVRTVNRVVLDITNKLPVTTEWESFRGQISFHHSNLWFLMRQFLSRYGDVPESPFFLWREGTLACRDFAES